MFKGEQQVDPLVDVIGTSTEIAAGAGVEMGLSKAHCRYALNNREVAAIPIIDEEYCGLENQEVVGRSY